ncbi:MAG TPA: DUF4062 domain-containing protein [Longimicrobium sp.]
MEKPNNVPDHPDVIVSGTFQDLIEHRKAVVDALLRLGFYPIGMEFDSAIAQKDVIASSYEKVDRAYAYVGIVSHRYGGVPRDSRRNPNQLSITELEYRRALGRGIPVYMFLMSDDHPTQLGNVETVEAYRAKLHALREDAQARSITAQFSSVESLKSLVLQSMAEFRSSLVAVETQEEKARTTRQVAEKRGLPSPPKPLAIPNFVSGHEFVGRHAELSLLDDWAASEQPMMVVEAIGGMGKSSLAWRWTQEQARVVRPDLAGVLWYSFYEGGADMAEFAAYALAYTKGLQFHKIRGKKTTELAVLLLNALKEEPFLLVLDGFERVLVAYHRLDASQLRDDQVRSDVDHRACTKPSDADLLRQLVAASPSKVLVTSRLMPSTLTNKAGQPLPGVMHHRLVGMHPDDALTMMRDLGIRSGDQAIRRYLTRHFDNHPLLIGITAGLVNDYVHDPGNFDRWVGDPQGGASLHLSRLDLVQRRTHILAAALTGLEPGVRQLLNRIAAFSHAVPFETVVALNPFLPPLPEAAGEPAADEDDAEVAHDRAAPAFWGPEELREYLPKLVSALHDLERRGLLQWDRKKNSYDLHPVVRGYAFDILEDTDRAAICNRIIDHFQSRPPDQFSEARTVADLQQSVDVFRALIQAQRHSAAVKFYIGDFAQALLCVEAPLDVLLILQPLFPRGFTHSPAESHFQSFLLTDVANSLFQIGQFSDAHESYLAALRIDLKRADIYSVWVDLLGLAASFCAENHIASMFSAIKLALSIAKRFQSGLKDERRDACTSCTYLKLIEYYDLTGMVAEAEVAHNEYLRLPTPRLRAIYRPGEAERVLCWLRFRQNMLTDIELTEAEAVARQGNNKASMRDLLSIRGELTLRRGDALLAATAFEQAIELTQAGGIPVAGLEARLAFAKARTGDIEGAIEICDRLQDSAQPPYVSLAETYLILRDPAGARDHALKGYRWAWSDGPPHARWWELARCRAVLQALGEAEPELPPSDPAALGTMPFEKDVWTLIGQRANEEDWDVDPPMPGEFDRRPVV